MSFTHRATNVKSPLHIKRHTVTSHQLQLQQEADRKAQEAAAEEASKAKKRVVTEDSYSQLVDSHNVNRDGGGDGARSVTEALSALGVQEGEDKHPERYFAAFNGCVSALPKPHE